MESIVSIPTCAPCPVDGFALPRISPETPFASTGAYQQTKWLIRLALIAEDLGWPLPVQDKFDPETVFQEQVKKFLAEKFPTLGTFAQASIDIRVTPEAMGIVLEACQGITTVRIEPVVTALEAESAGLGWYVAKKVLHQTEFQVYGPSIFQEAEYQAFFDLDEFSDRGQYVALKEDKGLDCDVNSVTDDEIAQAKNDYENLLWPSEMIDAVDNNLWLLGREKWPEFTRDQAASWLAENPNNPLAKVVHDAIVIDDNKSDLTAFLWDQSDDEVEQIGAFAIVCWNTSPALFKAIESFEVGRYEGGYTVYEAVARYVIDFDGGEPTDDQLRAMIETFQQYIDKWSLFESLLSNFPE